MIEQINDRIARFEERDNRLHTMWNELNKAAEGTEDKIALAGLRGTRMGLVSMKFHLERMRRNYGTVSRENMLAYELRDAREALDDEKDGMTILNRPAGKVRAMATIQVIEEFITWLESL